MQEICASVGIGRTKFYEICKTKPHGFPVTKVGNRYRADRERMNDWVTRLYNGEFEI